jgi:hypothetical protein
MENFFENLIVPNQSNGKVSFVDFMKQTAKRISKTYTLRYSSTFNSGEEERKHFFLLDKKYIETNTDLGFWTFALNKDKTESFLIQSTDGNYTANVKVWKGCKCSEKITSTAFYNILIETGILSEGDLIKDFNLDLIQVPNSPSNINIFKISEVKTEKELETINQEVEA